MKYKDQEQNTTLKNVKSINDIRQKPVIMVIFILGR